MARTLAPTPARGGSSSSSRWAVTRFRLLQRVPALMSDLSSSAQASSTAALGAAPASTTSSLRRLRRAGLKASPSSHGAIASPKLRARLPTAMLHPRPLQRALHFAQVSRRPLSRHRLTGHAAASTATVALWPAVPLIAVLPRRHHRRPTVRVRHPALSDELSDPPRASGSLSASHRGVNSGSAVNPLPGRPGAIRR